MHSLLRNERPRNAVSEKPTTPTTPSQPPQLPHPNHPSYPPKLPANLAQLWRLSIVKPETARQRQSAGSRSCTAVGVEHGEARNRTAALIHGNRSFGRLEKLAKLTKLPNQLR